jgi:16S rRNA (guanine527-N7)-methyltransferase
VPPGAGAFGAAEFAREIDVSRETLARLERYEALIRRWQPTINLVGSASLDELWRRHFLDSAQLRPLLPRDHGRIYDLGSGAGLPGLVLALLGAHGVELIESNRRKAAFLREAARTFGVEVAVHACRIEDLPPPSPDVAPPVLVSRALAPLDRLLATSRNLVIPGATILALKGEGVEAELAAARRHWRFTLETVPSLSDPRGCVVILRELDHV